MKRILLASVLSMLAFSAHAKDAAPLGVTLKGLDKSGRIDPQYAFCAPASPGHTKDGGNVSPEISWSGAPKETKSFAIITSDPDVPTDFSSAGKEGATIPADMKRQVFIHWVLVDIDPHTTRLPAGADSDRVEENGKHSQKTKYGLRGVNDYGKFKGGAFFGYDGPCPPWNDARMHHYSFTVYALDVRTLDLSGKFTAADAENAMKGHVLAKGSAVGAYTQNPAVK